ncbi:MAG: NRDE family protein, partial [Rhodothermales bacterium]|nr:NRDE family protein [Rhodothermales bacterium]
SRGALVREFLASGGTAEQYAENVETRGHRFNGFNLLLYDGSRLAYVTNRPNARARPVDSGIHGLSNADLDTPWPKVESGKRELERALETGTLSTERLLEILRDDVRAPDEKLPDTGVGLDLERALSSRFIRSDAYGTRSSTVVLIGRDGRIVFTEQTHIPRDTRPSTVEFDLIPT